MIDYLAGALARMQGWWGCSHCEKMHRRAQAAESAAAKVVRQNGHAQLWKTVAYLRHRSTRHLEKAIWRGKLYRAEIEKIRASGLVDTLHPGSVHLTGHLDILVDRLIAAAHTKGVAK